jgi:hypothetical protein
VPRHGTTSLSFGFAAVGVAGLVYSGITATSMRHTGIAYDPVLEDWLWHVILPILIYGALFAMAILVRYLPHEALYGVAAALMLLLFIGIHNAWDVAASISLRKQPDSPSQKQDSP